MTGAGRTILQGATALTGLNLDALRVLENQGTVTWSAGTLDLNATGAAGVGQIENALGGVFEATGNNDISSPAKAVGGDGDGASFTNAGTFRKSTGTGTTSLNVAFNNTGTVDVQTGTLSLNADVAQHAGNVLTGGTWKVSGNGILNLNEPGAVNIATNQGDVTLDGASASFTRINTLITNQGAFRLLGSRNFTAGGAFTNSGVLQLAGGTFSAPSLSNTGTGEIFGFGTITPTVLNSGLVRAAGGTLTATGGIDGQSGTLQSDAGATLALGANSDGDLLINNGALDLGTANVTVAQDYTNANFGSGNGFNARANVTGSGQILASGNVAQALTGEVSVGTGATPSMVFGNIHVGDVATKQFSIANTGTNGPALRGALQTNINGGNLTDRRLSGSGATAGNFGPVAVNSASAPLSVTLTGSSAGALADQRVAVVNNFDNVAEQVLGITGAVYRYANPTAHTPEPFDFGNRRVGDVTSQALSLTNNVAADGFSEALDASIGSATAGVTSNGGSFALLGAGATNDTSLTVGIDTTSAGHKAGTATISLASNGAGTSELGITALTSQTVNVSGDVFRLASASAHSPEPVVFTNRHVGDAASQALSLTNTAANDGFSERLNGSIGGVTGDATSNGGSFTLLDAGATDAGSLTVGIDTGSAGHKTGTATISLKSDGAGTSGFSALSLTAQTVNVSGDVYRLASANVISAVEFGSVHVGDVVSQAVSLSNTAANDGFSERLDASFDGVSDTRILTSGAVSGLGAGASDNTSLVIGLDTSTAGSLTGFATVNLTSNGTGTSGLDLTSLASQNVGVTTNVAVYRFAEGAIDNAQPIDFGAHRVGDGVSTVDVTVRNAATNDGFSEALNASVGAVDAGFTASGTAALVTAGASNVGGIQVGLDTSTAGVKSGNARVDYVSDGAGTSNLGQTAAGSKDVSLSGRVYGKAVAAVETTSIDFGVVHVGDVIGSQAVTVRNLAVGSLTDNLLGSIGAVPSGFTGAGTLGTGLTQGQASSALAVGLSTATAGVFSGNATLSFASHNAELADLGLTDGAVALNAQVNNYANAVLAKTGGDGSFGALPGGQFVFDFGGLTQGDSGMFGLLSLTNLVSGPSDTLGADFDINGGSFLLGDFSSFNGLAAGTGHTMSVGFEPLVVGLFEQVVRINLFGENVSGFHGSLGTFELTLRADVQPVPVPAAVWLFSSALAGIAGLRRRKAA